DHKNSVNVTVINETIARRLFRGGNPIGQHLSLGGDPMEVVGVVKDAKYDSVLTSAPPMLYVPMEQFPPAQSFGLRFFEIRTTGGAASFAARLRQVVQEIDENLSVESLPLTNLVGRSLALQRLIARLTGLFGALGLLLACVGVYGVMSYTVVQ